MNTARRILLIDPLGDGRDDAAAPLAQALERAGAQVRRIALPGHAEAVLDAIEQGWLPVALKPASGVAQSRRDPDAGVPREPPAAPGGEVAAPPHPPRA